MATLTHDTVPGAAPRRPVGRTTVGFGMAVTAAVTFGLSGAIARGLMDAGWSAGAAVTLRMLIAAVALTPFALVALRGRWDVVRRNAGLLLAFGLMAVALCQFAYFNAVRHLPVGVALLLEYIAPIVVVGWTWARHGERPTRLTIGGGLVAAVGLVLVLDVLGGDGTFSLIGLLWGLAAMVGVAFFFVVSAQEDNGLPGLVLATGGLWVGGTVLALLGLVGLVPMTATTASVAYEGFEAPWWACVLALAILTTAVSYTAGIGAGRRLGSRLASFVGLGEVLSALVFAWLLLAQVPKAVQLLGAVLVLAGVVAVKLGERAVVVAVEPVPEDPATERPGV